MTSPSPSTSNERACLSNINEYCLLKICQYLNLLDIQSLSSTCSGLREYLHIAILPRLSKSLKLYLTAPTSPVLHANFCVMSRNQAKEQILRIGEFVEHLSVTSLHKDFVSVETWRHFEYILRNCPNLQTLRISSIEFDTKCLNSVSTQLKEFHLVNSVSSNEDWSEILGKFPELEQLTIDGFHYINEGLLKNCDKLSYVAVNPSYSDREVISEANGHRIRTFKLYNSEGTDELLNLIRDKLPNLENLEVEDLNMSWSQPNYRLLEHKSLKKLSLDAGEHGINSILRALSCNGVIERLSIVDGLFDSRNIETYTFNKLKMLQWRDQAKFGSFNDFIKIFTLANMPEIENLYFSYYPVNDTSAHIEQDFDAIVKLVQSKKSLKLLSIRGARVTFSLVRKLIDMLKANRSDDRSFLRLDVYKLQTTDEEVNILDKIINLIYNSNNIYLFTIYR